MSSSPAKIAASRTNGALSKGPRTDDGKAHSSANSLKHGLCSSQLVVPGERAEEFADLRARLWLDLNPTNAIEQVLVERIIGCAWRLRRAVRIEGEMLERAGESRRMQHLLHSKGRGGPLREVGWAFEATEHGAFERLGRYEIRLERSLLRALHELERLRAGAIPLAIDVDVGGMGRVDAGDDSINVDADSFEVGFDAADDANDTEPPNLMELQTLLPAHRD